MTVLFAYSARLVIKRSLQRQHSLPPSARRQKSSLSEGSSEKSSPTKVSGKSLSTVRELSPQPFWERLGPLSEAFGAYARNQKRRPWATQIGTSLVVYLCGDLVAQKIDGETYNPLRTLRHLTIGGICSIPAYSWFMFLGRCFNYPSKIVSLATKVVVNQIVFTPIFNSYFFGMQALLSGDSFLDAWERIKRTVPTSFINSCKLWPAVTAFNFTYIQPQYRALFAGQTISRNVMNIANIDPGVVAVGWQSYLSWLNQQAAREERIKRGLQIVEM